MGTRLRVLFVAHDAGGTIPPVIATATALIADGHDVRILSQPSVASRAGEVGASFESFAGIADYAPDVAIEDQLSTALPLLVGDGPARQGLDVAGRFDADVVVVDPNLGGVLAAFEAASWPTVVLLHSIYATFVDVWFADLWPLLGSAVNVTRDLFGLPPAASWAGMFDGHDVVLSPVPESFNPTPITSEQVRHVGFLVPASSETRSLGAGEQPRVLVSLSTTHLRQVEQLQAILQALGRLPVRALVTTSSVVSTEQLDAPDNVQVETYIPHAAVLHSCDLVITHGGLGTVAAALSHGVPLVCQPVARDQPLNSERVAQLGAGVVVDVDASPEEIAGGIERVLAEPSFRRNAQDLASASERAGGARSAVASIVSLTR